MGFDIISYLEITQPDDWHVHLRDEKILNAVVSDSARQFARVVVMPNLNPPIETTDQAMEYYNRIQSALSKIPIEQDCSFSPLMTLYLTPYTTAKEIEKAYRSCKIFALKLYPANVTTNSSKGVLDPINQCSSVLETLQKIGMPLLIHGEISNSNIDVFDREKIFIERIMVPLRKNYPELKIVMEHISTKEAVDYICEESPPIAATITPQHLLYNRNSIFHDGLQPHLYCLPLLKREMHRVALLKIATSKNPRFFLGTDSAPHIQTRKEMSYGCAGCYTALHAMELYATAFEQVDKLDALETFSSFNGPDFYGLPRNKNTIFLSREPYKIPERLKYDGFSIIPLGAGKNLAWKLKKTEEGYQKIKFS